MINRLAIARIGNKINVIGKVDFELEELKSGSEEKQCLEGFIHPEGPRTRIFAFFNRELQLGEGERDQSL